MSTETLAAFARRLGVNRSTVTRHAQAGRIVLAGKRVDVEASLARLAQTTGTRPDVSARHAAQRGAEVSAPSLPKKTAPAPAKSAEEPADMADDGETGSKARYKAMALHSENSYIKLDMALRRGLRYSLPAVKREAAALGGTLRSALERLKDQTAPRLSVLADGAPRADLVLAELRAIRRLIRGEFARAPRRIRNHGAKP